MSKIKIKVIPVETIEVFSPNGSSCGRLNEIEFLDLRCQIKKHKVRGFYLYHDGKKIYINTNGFLSEWVPIFTSSIDLYNYILGIEQNERSTL